MTTKKTINKVLKVRLHQNTAVYRNPLTTEIVESYPLPPPSTVIGFIHSMIGIIEPKPNSMNISIQGEYSALLRDYQWYKKYDKAQNSFKKERYPILVHTLFDVSLVLHIYFPDEFEYLGKEVERAIKVPPYFPYLGRAEDLVKIEDVDWIEVKLESIENGWLKNSALISQDSAAQLNLKGVPYKLSGYYRYIPLTIKKKTKIIRDFDWLNIQYIEKGAYFEAEKPNPIWVDEEGDFIWWSLPNPIL